MDSHPQPINQASQANLSILVCSLPLPLVYKVNTDIVLLRWHQSTFLPPQMCTTLRLFSYFLPYLDQVPGFI